MTSGELWRRIRQLLQRDRATQELEEEMRLHLELRASALRARARDGCVELDALAAHAAARRRFGNETLTQQRSRDTWGFANLDALRSDIRFAVRRLAQRPGFAAAVVGVLALGIGATTAMFSAVDAALLRPLPFRDPHELVWLYGLRVERLQISKDPNPSPGPRILDAGDVMKMTDIFSNVAVYAQGGLNLADPDRPQRVKAGVVTANFFATLGVAPLKGRTFAPEEGVPNGPSVAVLSYGLWQRQFGGRDITGLNVTLTTRSFQVIGVMPPGFGFPQESEIWIPLTVPTTAATYEAFQSYLTTTPIARLADGVTVEAAEAQLRARWEQNIAAQSRTPGRKYNFDDTMLAIRQLGSLQPLQRQLAGDRRTALFVLLGATGFLLLIACANVTNLLLSQAALRQREIAVREVLGATRARIVRQLLTESLVLSLTGAAIGLALAPVALRAIGALMPSRLAGVTPATVDLRVLGFATVLSIAVAIGFGLWPALGSTRSAPVDTIKAGGGHGATHGSAGRLRRTLVGAELALTIVLLVGAGLMLRSFSRLMGEDNGIRASSVGTLQLAMPREGESAGEIAKLDAVLTTLSASPGIEAAGIVNDLPLSGSNGMGLSVSIDGVPRKPGAEFPRFLLASGGYFRALGIRLIKGRVFTDHDDKASPQVAVIGERMAAKFWPGQDPIGRTFRLDAADKEFYSVIGVVADVRVDNIEKAAKSAMYFSVHSQTPHSLSIVARGTLERSTLLARMVDAVHAVDPAQAVFNVRMMDEVIGTHVAPRRTNTILIAAFAAVALLLAALGVYAVVSQGVTQRSREFGIRSALGATGRDLISLIAREMVWVTVASVAVGLAGAWALARVVSGLVYGVNVHDPFTFALVPVALMVPAAIATLIPAWRATRVNPASVMQAD